MNCNYKYLWSLSHVFSACLCPMPRLNAGVSAEVATQGKGLEARIVATTGWWFSFSPSEKNIGQLGWWNSQDMANVEKQKVFQITNQIRIASLTIHKHTMNPNWIINWIINWIMLWIITWIIVGSYDIAWYWAIPPVWYHMIPVWLWHTRLSENPKGGLENHWFNPLEW